MKLPWVSRKKYDNASEENEKLKKDYETLRQEKVGLEAVIEGTNFNPLDCLESAIKINLKGKPEIMARLIMRGLRCMSRLMVTTEPLGRVAPKAAPNLALNSGVRSMLTTPVTP